MFQAKAKRRQRYYSKSRRSRSIGLRPVSRRVGMESLEPRMMLTATPGTWTALANIAPAGNVGTLELLSDGTVLAAAPNSSAANTWLKLTPDATGSYVNGAWSQAASDSVGRVYDAENVLQDGRVFVLGGEQSVRGGAHVWNNTGEIYNPVTNTWTAVPNFPEPTFGGPTELLPDGRVLAGSMNGPNTYIYDPAANTWSPGPTKLYNDSSILETWTKLPDGSILSYDLNEDVGTSPTEAQRLDPLTMTWIDAGTVPVALQSNAASPRIGPAVLLPDGRLFQEGGDSNTALYNPATNTWAAGPVIPGGLGGNVATAAMMPNGHVLFDASATPVYGSPTRFFEFDPSDNSLTDVTPTTPDLSSTPSYDTRLLVVPTGQVLYGSPLNKANTQLYVYTPVGSPQAAWQPTIGSVASNGDGTFTLTGTQLNGLSAGASYGSPAEMDSNYPLVELQATDGSGHEYFARTFNWSSTGVATGSTPVSTEFATAAFMPYGTYNLIVVANGIASAPVSFTGGVVGPSADLAVTNNGPTASTEGSNVTYSLTVTNNGPTTATNVVLTDTLGANLKYVSATKSQGTSSQSGSLVTFSFGTLAVGQTVTATVTAQALEDGNLTNSASVASSLSDANPYNNSASATTAVAEPAIVVSAPITVSGKNQNNVTVATFTHASGVEPASAFVATINWGDNSTSTGTVSLSGTTYTVKGSHSYAQGGSHTVTTTVVESGGAMNSAMFAFASIATTPAASTSSSVNAPTKASARDAVIASLAGFGGSNAPLSSKVDGAGAQPVADLDSLDALFELINGSESGAFHLGTSDG
jgi:uncharacterized repeat protein (TIGR01451 family)